MFNKFYLLWDFTWFFSLLAARGLFSFFVRWADEYEKETSANAVHKFGQHFSNRMLHDMFADCDEPAVSDAFLYSNTTVVRWAHTTWSITWGLGCYVTAAHAQHSRVSTHDIGLFSRNRQPSERKRKELPSASRERGLKQLAMFSGYWFSFCLQYI